MDGGWQAAKRPVKPRSCSGGRGGPPRGTAFRFEVLGGDDGDDGVPAMAVQQDALPVRCLLTGMELGAGAGRQSGQSAPAGRRLGARKAVPRGGRRPRT